MTGINQVQVRIPQTGRTDMPSVDTRSYWLPMVRSSIENVAELTSPCLDRIANICLAQCSAEIPCLRKSYDGSGFR
jgi:hypothetical protein